MEERLDIFDDPRRGLDDDVDCRCRRSTELARLCDFIDRDLVSDEESSTRVVEPCCRSDAVFDE